MNIILFSYVNDYISSYEEYLNMPITVMQSNIRQRTGAIPGWWYKVPFSGHGWPEISTWSPAHRKYGTGTKILIPSHLRIWSPMMFSAATPSFQARLSATCTKRPMRRNCLSGVALHCDLAVPISSLISDNIDSNTSEIVVKSDFFVWQSIYIRVRWDSFDLRVKSGDV